MTVQSNSWALVTFVANYTGANTNVLTTTPSNTVFYQVYVNGTNVVPASTYCYAHGSPFTNNTSGTYLESSASYSGSGGINGFYLSGSGAMNTLLATTGTPSINTGASPLSSSISIRAYQGAGGVYVEFQTHDEGGILPVILTVMQANSTNIIWQGAQASVGSGNNFYRFLVPGLTLGSAYSFSVTDESGKTWSIPPTTVTAFAASMLQMSPVGLTMSFNTSPGLQYSIQWTPQLGGTWQSVTNITAISANSSVFVFFPDPKAPSGFFRIVQQ
jgi:hypothetical protein